MDNNKDKKDILKSFLNDEDKARELLQNYLKSDLYKQQCENWDKICDTLARQEKGLVKATQLSCEDLHRPFDI